MRRLAWVPAVLVATGCAARVFTPPSGPAVPFADAAPAWEQATARCRGAQRYVAELQVRGWVWVESENRRQRLANTLHAAVTRTDDIYLEAIMFGTTAFQMAGVAGQSTFLLPRDARVLRAPTRDIVTALTGLEWGGRELLDVLTGCVAAPAGAVSGERTGAYLHIALSPSTSAWLRDRDGQWQVHAARIGEWIVEYRLYDGGWPTAVRITSSGETPLDLQFTPSQIKVNIPLDASTFSLNVPDHFLPMTLEELRAIGPLRERGRLPDSPMPIADSPIPDSPIPDSPIPD